RRLVGMVALVAAASLTALPGPARAQTAPCPVSSSDLAVDAEEQQLLDLVNTYRLNNGRGALTMDTAVTRAAAWFSRDMATKNYFPANHVDMNGRDIPTRLTWCGVPWQAWRENIYFGSGEAETVFEAWRTSPPHNTNLLATDITLAGVARSFNASSVAYWVMDYTTPAAGAVAVVSGSTWYSNGSKTRSGPVGTAIQAYAVGAIPNVPYRLVLGTGAADKACVTTVQVINPTIVFAGSNGIIGRVSGTVQAGLAPGTYKLCFEDSSTGNYTGTGGATFTVTA
ncbi:MAG TPA: CAP domain-containing protein, partial [Acidimicrobiales bacterium]|nr:CAP domain-containing protein [Acidimicrobiales bacterium]